MDGMHFDKNIRSKLLAVISHPYSVVTGIYIVWAGLLDPFGFLTHLKLRMQLKALQNQINIYREKAKVYKDSVELLKSSKEFAIRIARERYLMAKPDEDIFILADR